jgi:hypothetical protein
MCVLGEALRWGGRGSPAKLKREVRLRSMGDSLAVLLGGGAVVVVMVAVVGVLAAGAKGDLVQRGSRQGTTFPEKPSELGRRREGGGGG